MIYELVENGGKTFRELRRGLFNLRNRKNGQPSAAPGE
jgi:hypothetical protein